MNVNEPQEQQAASASEDGEADQDFREIQEELRLLGAGHGLAALILKRKATEVVSFGSPVVLIPMDMLASLMGQGAQEMDAEVMSLAMRRTVDQLRPHGPTILLGESLLSLAWALRMYEPPERLIELNLEAIRVFKDCGATRQLGRAYVDLGTILKNGQDYYDALAAFELALEYCGASDDLGGVAASYYHRGHICRMLKQHFEALQLLTKAETALPSGHEDCRKQIRSERIFNQLELRHDADALVELNAWIHTDDRLFYPFCYRGEIYERRGNLDQAFADYLIAAQRLAERILKSHSDRFQRVDRSRYDFVFERGLRLALRADAGATALALLELANTGASGLQSDGEPGDEPLLREAMEKLQAQAAPLATVAAAAVQAGDAERLRRLQEQAEWLVAERELLGAAMAGRHVAIPEVQELGRTLTDALPANNALLELAVVDDTVWIVASVGGEARAYQTALTQFDLALLAASFQYECDALDATDALCALASALLAPVASVLAAARSLSVVLAPEILGIPFHALEWDGRPLMETHEVTYVPRGLTLVERIRRGAMPTFTPASRCDFVGVSSVSYTPLAELPGVRLEGEIAARVFD